MPRLLDTLDLDRCPHCGIAHPSLPKQASAQSNNHEGTCLRIWCFYCCLTCGGYTIAAAPNWGMDIQEQYPKSPLISPDIPDRAREYLRQATESLFSAAGAVMLAASAVDAMLRAKGLTVGTLNARIDEAAKTHLITEDMAKWAHQVRLDANAQRHSDDNSPFPTMEEATRVINFAHALAQFMFELPAMVARGISATTSTP